MKMLLAAWVAFTAVFGSLLAIETHRVRRKQINNFCNSSLEEETNSVFSTSRSRFDASCRQQQHHLDGQFRLHVIDVEVGSSVQILV